MNRSINLLIENIKNNPSIAKSHLDEFETSDIDLKNFLESLKLVPAEIIPSLIKTFVVESNRVSRKTVLDIVKSASVGTLFTEVLSGTTYQFTGFHDGSPTFIEFGKKDQVGLDMELEVKWIF